MPEPSLVWLDGPDAAGEDEALPEPEEPGRPKWLALVVGLAVVAACVVTALVHGAGGTSRQHGRKAPPAVTRPVIIGGDRLVRLGDGRSAHVHAGIVIGPLGAPVAASRPPAPLRLPDAYRLLPYVESHVPCPEHFGCDFIAFPSPRVRRAVRSTLPGAHDIRAASASVDGRLTVRALRARVGRHPVEVVVHLTNPGDSAGTGTFRHGQRWVRAVLDRWTIDVQAPRQVRASWLVALAYDPALHQRP